MVEEFVYSVQEFPFYLLKNGVVQLQLLLEGFSAALGDFCKQVKVVH